MKKRLLVLGMIACLFGLTACGQETQTANVTEENVQAMYIASSIVYQVDEIVAEGLEAEYIQYDPSYEAVFNNWKDGIEKIGGYVETNTYTVTTTNDQVIVDLNVTGAATDASGNAAKANVELVFDAEDYTIVSLTVGEASAATASLPAELTSPIGIAMLCVIAILLIMVIVLNNKLKNQNADGTSVSGTGKSVDNTIAGIMKAEENDTELVAVISAAIAAYESANGGTPVSADGVVIRSIRKVNKTRWQKA